MDNTFEFTLKDVTVPIEGGVCKIGEITVKATVKMGEKEYRNATVVMGKLVDSLIKNIK